MRCQTPRYGLARGAMERQRRPEPRLALGASLVGMASSCIDLSDGLVQDAGHLSAASRVALHLDARALPVSSALAAAYPEPRARARAAATGGEDYELLFTTRPSRQAEIQRLSRRHGLRLTRIGEVRRGRGVHLAGLGRGLIEGFDHLA